MMTVSGLVLVLVLGALGIHGWRRSVLPAITEVRMAPTQGHIGEPVVVRVEVRLHWRDRLRGTPRLDVPEELGVIGDPEISTSGFGIGAITREVTFVLQPFALGSFAEMQVQVPLRGAHATLVAELPSLEIVPRLEAEPPDAAPELAPPVDAAWLPVASGADWLFRGTIVAGALVAAILTGWCLWYLRRRLNRRAIVPPWTVAKRELDDLEARLPMAPDPFIVGVTDCVRRYLEAAYGYRATEQTTPEFLREIEAHGERLTMTEKAMLKSMLMAADSVKFARGRMEETRMREILAQARQLVADSSERLLAEAEARGRKEAA